MELPGRISAEGKRAATNHHPAIIISGKVKPNNGVYPAGLAVVDSAEGLIPYTGTGTLKGVVDATVNTASHTVCPVLVHGTADKGILTKSGGAALEDADLAALEAIGVYAV